MGSAGRAWTVMTSDAVSADVNKINNPGRELSPEQVAAAAMVDQARQQGLDLTDIYSRTATVLLIRAEAPNARAIVPH